VPPGNDEHQPVLTPRAVSIRNFGAKGDGKSLDTVALQAAIDACTRDGGGTVLVPSGRPLVLR
jgi:polygalacturonase